MNTTIVSLTARAMLGRRRGIFLLVLPLILMAMAIGVRMAAGADEGQAIRLLSVFAVSVIVPLLGLIVGTGVIGPEIDDGSVVYVLSKPLPRLTIVISKLVVAIGCMVVFAGVPTLIAGLILGAGTGLAVSFAIGAIAAGIAYCALFLLLAIVTKHAVVVGLFYSLIWESLVGNLISGAQVLSIQSWGLSIAKLLSGAEIKSAVSFTVGVPLLIAVIVVATWYAGNRLRSLTLNESE